MKFDKVNIEHITLGVNNFNEKDIPEGFGPSNYFDVEIDGVLYPPKPIMAYANYHATGEEPENNFSGGRRTPCFKAFKRLEIRIVPKSNPKDLQKYIELYKRLISNQIPEVNYNELYKWETFQHFKANWNDEHDESNIVENFEKAFITESNNLWSGSHYLPLKMLKQFAEDRPIKVSQMMHQLFDEEHPLNGRLLQFENSSSELLNELRPNEDISHYQSRRAMMLYLSLRYPNKYFLYKNGMFNDFCKISKFWPPFGTAKKLDYTVLDEFLQMCREVKEVLLKDEELLELHNNIIPDSINLDDENNLLVQDFIYAVATYLNPTNQIDTKQTTTSADKINTMDNEIDLNQIFFGPPGTGKTYHTINEAIKIVDPDFYQENKNDRDKLKDRFKLLLLNKDNEDVGQIGFTTFHQSFSYEDFIEGIKPVKPEDGVKFLKYKIEDGIFKTICRIANDSIEAVAFNPNSLIALSSEEFEKAHFYKMSLGNTKNEDDDEIFDYCVENNCITIGFGDGLDFTGKDEKELKQYGQEKQLEQFPIQAMNLFCNYLKVGNYVVISYGNNYVRAIGKVVGDYEYVETSPFPNSTSFNHFRKVEWIFTNKHISAKEIYNKNLQQQSIYKLEKKEVKQEFFVKEKKVDLLKLPKNPKNFVLIVDEINRGNVSSIFGELITLIEKDKRAGAEEELSAILPYSKDEFKVPQNVYIIGTMNTADRSIEALDTALRRRFSFREMPPKSELILTDGKLKEKKGKIGDIDLVQILETINNRVEKLIDKDHAVGHSYFLGIENLKDLEDAFENKVIPLLEEYFFGDFGKIGLVLGSSFITNKVKKEVKFASFDEYDSSIIEDLEERSVYQITDKESWNFKSIYE